MRNLKKILAMVLALVMSLSLMATASAADFKDASDINDKYQVAVDVLEGLGVFKGYDENGSYSFKPTGSITRAETAAIIYRIVTGDVKDEQVKIYSDYNIFTDVPSTAWYAGYVNFCANAEYIKGVGNGKFDPQGQVTGYAALAMILRAIGYTANGGFTGPDWAIQTARTAEARKITKNINTGTLGNPANRETVAEILFQSILVGMVNHNVLNTLNGDQGYTITDTTLGYKTFGLEEVTGVVVGNEYADLNSNQVLGSGRTDLLVGEEVWHLNYGTEITDVGEARRVFTTNKTGVVGMYDNVDGVALNKVTEFGHACDISGSKFSSVAEMGAASDIEYYVNFDRVGHYDCDQRLEFVVKFQLKKDAGGDSITYYPNSNTKTYSDLDEIVEHFENLYVGGLDLRADVGMTVVAGSEAVGSTTVTYSKIIRAKDEITQDDMNVIRGIFYAADNQNSTTTLYQGVEGDVYVGTRSNNANDTDWSDELSYAAWRERFINDISYDISWATSWNGDWVKFVDNDKDGKADYAFKTHYGLDEALYTYTDRDGNVTMQFTTFDDENYAVRYLDGYTPAVGDKVLAAWIDNQYLVEPANSETVTVSSYSWRNDEITTDKGTYGQSGIDNNTEMLELISTMEDKVEYVVYFDHFGYVRAYELPGGTKYALITEMYYTNGNQGNLVKDWPMTAELTTLDDEGKTVTDEYNVASGQGTFTALQPWMRVENAVATYNYNNWLQPAIAHLGVDYNIDNRDLRAHKGTPVFTAGTGSSDDIIAPNAYVTFWNANRQLVRDIADNGMAGCEEFNWGAQNFNGLFKINNVAQNWSVDETASFTNVAVVNINDKDASLTGAATLNLDKTTAKPNATHPYARDYIQLATTDIVADAVRYTIHDHGSYQADNNYYVNAVHDTQYFIAYNGGVYAFTDFDNFPGLTNKDNKIHAAYAVARNTNSDLADKPYWVADVIVYEVYNLSDDVKQTSVSLAFYTPTRTSGNVQEIDTLNSKYGPEVQLIPENRAWNATNGQWGAEWEGYGFYALYNDTEPVDGVMTATDITRIGAEKTGGSYVQDYTKNNIHAGVITREAYIDGKGHYIDVDMGGGKIVSIEITNKIYSITTAYAQSDNRYSYFVATPLRYETQANSQVRKGDSVIWVGGASTQGLSGAKNSTSFVVDLGSTTDWNDRTYSGLAILEDTPDFLIETYVDSNKDTRITAYAGVGYASGEWQKIMNEQNTTPMTTVTAVGVDADDAEVEVAVSLSADAGVTFDNPVYIATSALTSSPAITITVPAPYEITKVEMTNAGEDGAGKNAQIVATNVPGVYKLVSVTDDVELKVTAKKATKTLAIDNQTGGIVPTMTLTYGEAPDTTTVDPWNGAATALVKGTAYTVTIAGAAGVVYEVDGTEYKVGPSGKVTIAGTLDDDTVLVVKKLTRTLAITPTADVASFNLSVDGGTASAWDGTEITLNKDAAYVIEFTAAADTTYGAAKNGGNVVKQTETAGKVTIAGDLDVNTVYALSKLTKTLTGDFTDATEASSFTLSVNGGADTAWDGTEKTVNEGATFTLKFTPDAGYEYKINNTVVTAETTGTDTGKIVYSGTVDTDTTLVVTETQKTVRVSISGTNVKPISLDIAAGTALKDIEFTEGGTAGEVVVALADGLTAAAYNWPATITVKIGGRTVVSGYTWTQATQTIAFTATDLLSADLEITVDATMKTFTVGTLDGITTTPTGTVDYDGTVVVTIADATKVPNGVWYSTDGGTNKTALTFDIYGVARIENVQANLTFYAAAN